MKQQIMGVVKRLSHFSAVRPMVSRYKHTKRIRDFRDWSAEDQRRMDFYAKFVRPGETVFDVGANLGNRTKIFLKLEARVVAVEPQRECADFLESVLGNDSDFWLARTALGACQGESPMLVSNAHTISSLSPSWIRAVQTSGRFGDCEWNETEMVSVDTLDNLIAKYGSPSFVKIDVEGFEYEVVSGLSQPVKALSLEFTPEFLEPTLKCIDHLCEISAARFQISLEESMHFYLPRWVSAEEVKSRLSELDVKTFGDLYVQFDIEGCAFN